MNAVSGVTPPPLPPGCEGYPVAPNIHTGADEEPERDGWTDLDVDLQAVTAKWLQQCGSCDAGLSMNCTCPTDDYRPVMAVLVNEVQQLRNEIAEETAS